MKISTIHLSKEALLLDCFTLRGVDTFILMTKTLLTTDLPKFTFGISKVSKMILKL